MKVIFAGTPEFARAALEAIVSAGIDVPLVLTQPDRPAGRGMKLQASAVKQFAVGRGIAVAQPRSLRLDGKFADDAAVAQAAIAAAGADAMVVAAYGLILPQWVLDAMASQADGAAGWGCLNIHASLLPRWRGAAPIHRAIEAGDVDTGITIMQMDAGLDTGAMLRIERLRIAADDTTGQLHDRLAALGAQMAVQALHDCAAGTSRATPQPAAGITYAHKIDKAEAAIDWALPAQQIARRVRAFDPFPGATGVLEGEVIKIWCSDIDSCLPRQNAGCGHILHISDDGIVVQCGDGALRITMLQRPGGKRLSAADFLRGSPLRTGQRFDLPTTATATAAVTATTDGAAPGANA